MLADLERGSLLEDLFRLPHVFAVTDLLFARELSGTLGDRLLDLGLRVEELSPAELRRATVIRRQHAHLSVCDAFVFAVAEARRCPLLAEDGGLRRLIIGGEVVNHEIAVHDTLWLLDQLEAEAVVTPARLSSALLAIVAHPRCRLSELEVRRRISRLGPV